MNRLSVLVTAILWLNTLTLYSQDIPIAIKNAIVINGLGGEPLKGYDVLIENGKIVDIGKNMIFPKKSRIIDATGKSVIPGLIDMHGHLNALGASQTGSFPDLYLAGGVTTIYSPGEYDLDDVFGLREEIRRNHRVGPDIFFAPYFDSYPSPMHFMKPVVDSVALIKRFDAWKDQVDGIKVYSRLSREHFDILMRKAKENHLRVTGHLGTLSTRYAVEHGIDGLEHGLFGINDFGVDPNDVSNLLCGVSRLDLASESLTTLVDLIIEKSVYVDPTMVIFEVTDSDFNPYPKDYESYLDEKAKEMQAIVDKWVSDQAKQGCVKEALAKQRQFVKLVYDKKGLLVAGTDPGSAKLLPGFGMKKEIEFFVLSGIPLVEAIKIASYNGAVALGISATTGSLEKGKNADLSIYDGDVTQQIELLRKPEFVLKHGKTYYPDSLLMRVKGKVTAIRARK